MLEAYERQIFNDDLLANSGDLTQAAENYGTILHVLDHPELRECFKAYDEPAKDAKHRSRALGLTAIILATLAILLASAEVTFGSKSGSCVDEGISCFVALVASLLGIASVVVGLMGLLLGRAKKNWLHQRLMTEKLRQFHFQTFIFRLSEILASLQSENAKAEFKAARHKWFDAFRTDVEKRLAAAFTDIIENEQPEVWLHKPPEPSPIVGDHPQLQPLFSAYRELRIRHQISYANYKLRDDHRIFSGAARRQATELEAVGLVCIALLLFIHIGIALVVMASGLGSSLTELIPFLDLIIIWIAVGALALRALQQGLQPEREIERYQQYRSTCKAVLERFDAAASQNEKVQIMKEMERLSFDEMRNFLLTNNRSRFVM